MATYAGNCKRWNPHGRGNLGEAVTLIAPLYGEGMSVTPYKRERSATNLFALVQLIEPLEISELRRLYLPEKLTSREKSISNYEF
jgi:hypothetical protein